MTQTIQQQRAAFALKEVQRVLSGDRKVRINNPELRDPIAVEGKEFRSYASNLPAMIRMSGLGQAAAFCKAKGASRRGAAWVALYDILSEWLTRQGQPYSDKKNLLDGITQADMHHYRVAQAEALALLDWVKKFATAFVGGETQEDNP